MDISQPIDAYFARIDDCIQFASDGKTPFTAQQILTTALHAVQKTGWFRVGIREWKTKDTADQTWENFKKDFAKEYDEIKEEQGVTAQAAGYTQANNVVQISDALDNLANAALADRRTVEDLSTANKELAEANKQLTTQMNKINEKLDSMTRLLKAIPTSRFNSSDGRFNQRGGRATNNQWRPREPMDPHGYCWSCGFKVSTIHNSVTCERKKDGHQDAATRSNTMGGNQFGKQQS
jgi:hypothetical protein